MKKLSFFLIIIFQTQFVYSQDQHVIFTEVLKDYIIDGFVNYADLKNDNRLDTYLNQLANTDTNDFQNENDELAFWINAYNAFTLQVIVENYPLESINDLHFGGLIIGSILSKTIWDDDRFVIKDKKYSLNNIEHDIIREKFNEPRIHFAVVCASISCPLLLNEAYEGHKLIEQLEKQTIAFFNDESRNKFNLKNRVAEISKIMDWYDDDFGDNDSEVLKYISKFLEDKISKDVLTNINEWKIDYLPYDWGLNEVSKKSN